jgi:hypothetical protein
MQIVTKAYNRKGTLLAIARTEIVDNKIPCTVKPMIVAEGTIHRVVSHFFDMVIEHPVADQDVTLSDTLELRFKGPMIRFEPVAQ